MIYSDRAINILAAKTYKGIGRGWIVRNMARQVSINDIVEMLTRDSKGGYQISESDFMGRKEKILYEISAYKATIDGIMAIGEQGFPEHRGIVKNSERPVVLFYRGDLSLLSKSNKNIAVIGLLTPDTEIENIEKEVVIEFVARGANIVSGLALGCDSIAHRQALISNGKTIAILPGTLNDIIPAKNRELAEEIVSRNGLLITEYYSSAGSKIELGGRYQERDRLQALFSDIVVLAASYAKNDQGLDSGSRLAMEYASSYSIMRAVIYDPDLNKCNPKYDLNRQIISDNSGQITVINRGNFADSITAIFSVATEDKGQPHQTNLFEII